MMRGQSATTCGLPVDFPGGIRIFPAHSVRGRPPDLPSPAEVPNFAVDLDNNEQQMQVGELGVLKK